MTILLICGMFGLPTTMLASILAVDWLLDRLDGLCKVVILILNHDKVSDNDHDKDDDVWALHNQPGFPSYHQLTGLYKYCVSDNQINIV